MNPVFNKVLFFRVLVLLCFICISSITIAQKRPPQNLRRITVTSQYVLENGNRTNAYWAIYQEMFDSLGRMHTEVNLDFPDHAPHSYIWHTYKGKQRVKTEIFEHDRLQWIKEYLYEHDSLISKEIVRTVKPGDTTLYYTLTYKYNKFKKPIQVNAITPTGKKAYSSKSIYDSNGIELSRTVNEKNGYYPEDSILNLSNKPQYDSIGRLVSNITTTTKVDKKPISKVYSYVYNKKNKTTFITIRDPKGNLLGREELYFQVNRNRLQQIKYYDSNDKLVKWLAKRYEIYRTNDIIHREIEY